MHRLQSSIKIRIFKKKRFVFSSSADTKEYLFLERCNIFLIADQKASINLNQAFINPNQVIWIAR